MRHTVLAALAVVVFVGSASAQSFNVGANFQTATGGTGAGSEALVTPPDTQGAAGQNHIMILNNGRYKTFNKIGSQVQTKSGTQFFGDAGYSPVGADQNISGDPRVQFDPLSGRWFAVNFTDGDASGINNRLVIAVSENANPTGAWKSTFIETTNGTFADFPTFGIDRNGVYLGTNNFSSAGSFTGVSLFTAAKSGLLWTGGGTPSLSSLTTFQGLTAGSPNFAGVTPQPTNNFDPNQSGNTNRVIAGYNNTNLRTYNIQNTGGTTTLGAGSFIVVNSMPSPPNVAQPDGTQIDTGDNRIGANTIQVGNNIYTVNSFDNGSGRSQVRFTVVNASTGALVQQGDINSPSLAFFHPAIAVNEHGHAVVSFTGASSTQFPSVYAAVSTSSGSLSFGAPTLISAGPGNYNGFDGQPYRWGDYSAATVDPADTGIFWTFQERSTAVLTQYATQATEIVPTIANEVRWKSAANGNYSTAASWFNDAVPTATSHVIYSRNGTAHTVTLPAGVTTNDRISVRQGNTTFSIAAGSTYQATNTSAATPSFAVSPMLGDSTVTISGGGTFSTVYTTLAAGQNGLVTDNISKATVNVNGSTWNNSRDVHLGGSSTRSGGTATLNINSSGTVTVGEVARFWTSGSGININGSTLNVGGLRADAGVTPAITGTGAAVLNITNGMSQTYSGTIGGTVSITKSGTGTQTLAGPMSYTGTTTVNGGRLNINGGKSGTGAVNVNNTGVLGGAGIVGGLVTVNSGGTIAPGLSPGNLTLTGGLNMTAGTYEWELTALTESGAGTNYDLITLSGGASTLGGTSQVQLAFPTAGVNPNTPDPFWLNPHQWTIVDLLSGTLSGNFSGISNPQYAFGNFFLSGGNGDVFLNYRFAPVPEPSAFALAGVSLAGWLVWRRRRKPNANNG